MKLLEGYNWVYTTHVFLVGFDVAIDTISNHLQR